MSTPADTSGGTLTPDPTVLTTEASARAKESSDKVDALRDESLHRELELRQLQRESEVASIRHEIKSNRQADQRLVKAEQRSIREQIKADRRVLRIMEAHRLELKSDSEKTLATATIAAEKAVQAALAAAEKARDQQTIASQLATTKAEEASKERQDQQGETFTTGIAGLAAGFNDVKLQLSELRAERRGGQEQIVVARDDRTEHRSSTQGTTQIVAVAIAVLALAAALFLGLRSSGGKTGGVDTTTLPACTTAVVGQSCISTAK